MNAHFAIIYNVKSKIQNYVMLYHSHLRTTNNIQNTRKSTVLG